MSVFKRLPLDVLKHNKHFPIILFWPPVIYYILISLLIIEIPNLLLGKINFRIVALKG